MKALLLITIFSLGFIQIIQAHNDSIVPKNIYKLWINTKMAGAMFETEDSSIVVSNSLKKTDYCQGKYKVEKIDARNISELKIRKMGNVAKGALYGAIAGLVVGGVVDLIYYASWKNYDPPDAHGDWGQGIENMMAKDPLYFTIGASLVGAACIGIGAGIGAGIGSAKFTIPINGSREQFARNRSTLDKYSIKPNPVLKNQTFSKLRDTVVDIDGNVYSTLALGGQVWMGENLRVSHHRDGAEIAGITTQAPGDERRYSWLAVIGKQKICPVGWHVPELFEWTSMIRSLGGEDSAGSKMEITFSALGRPDQWWSSTELDADRAQYIYLNNKTTGAMFTGKDNASGLAVRCIRD